MNKKIYVASNAINTKRAANKALCFGVTKKISKIIYKKITLSSFYFYIEKI